MATYERQGTAPIEEGDSLDPEEIEAEFTAIATVINGGLNNANLTGSAAITGGNMATATITGAKIASNTVTKSKMNQDAISQVQLSSVTPGASSLTSQTDFQDCPNTVDLTVSNLAQNKDWVILTYQAAFKLNVSSPTNQLFFAFEIDGTESSVEAGYPFNGNQEHVVFMQLLYKATASSHVFRPRVKMQTAISNFIVGTNNTVVFTSVTIPAK